MRTLPSISLKLVATGLVTLLSSCGSPSQRPAQNATTQEASVEHAPSEAPPEKGEPDCTDGRCIVCGDTRCPKGFFCDESNGKASCQWVPTCTDTVDCGCVKKTLNGECDCNERNGGTYLRCTQ